MDFRSNEASELERIGAIDFPFATLDREEHSLRLQKATQLMEVNALDAVYLSAGSNLLYFTGACWRLSERLCGALLTPEGTVDYIVPWFEQPTFRQVQLIDGELHGWHEDDSPFTLLVDILRQRAGKRSRVGIDETTPFHHFGEIAAASRGMEFVDARPVTAGCRSRKSDAEIRLIQTAMNMTLEVQKSAAAILREGISTAEVVDFIERAHRRAGADGGSTFCAVQFGEATAYPHGVPYQQNLNQGDMVLIDTGCKLRNYNSDITRCYVFGEATDRQREVWNAEKTAQATAFSAAKLGVPCGSVDTAVRDYLESEGYGPNYEVPGLPHRTGHGIGLDIHEWPYLVRGDKTPLDVGMCFSNEPMLCLPGEFGVRLEDHFYMTETGARWFTQPGESIDEPFGARL